MNASPRVTRGPRIQYRIDFRTLNAGPDVEVRNCSKQLFQDYTWGGGYHVRNPLRSSLKMTCCGIIRVRHAFTPRYSPTGSSRDRRFAFDILRMKVEQHFRQAISRTLECIRTQQRHGMLLDYFIPQFLQARCCWARYAPIWRRVKVPGTNDVAITTGRFRRADCSVPCEIARVCTRRTDEAAAASACARVNRPVR